MFFSDGLENLKCPNGDASFLRNGFILSQLDGKGMRIIVQQQQMHIKESVKENLSKQAAITKRAGISNLRHSSNAETKTDKIQQHA